MKQIKSILSLQLKDEIILLNSDGLFRRAIHSGFLLLHIPQEALNSQTQFLI